MIRVSVGSGFFNIKISGASFPVDFSWPEKLLGLQAVDTQSCSNFCPNLERQDVAVQPLFVSHGAKEMVRSDDIIKQVSDGKGEVLGLTHQIKNIEDNDSRFLGLVKAPALNSLHVLEKIAGGPGVKDRKQLIDCNKLTNVCSQFQNSNKKGNDSRKVESLAINSTYSKLRKDKGNSRVNSSRDGIEKSAKVGDVSFVLQDDLSDSSVLLSSRFGKDEILNQVDDGLERKEVGLKVDGPGRALVEWASSKFERTTQSLDLKAQSGGMAVIDPVSSKFIAKVCIARKSVDESEEGLDEVNEEGAGRDAFGSEVGEVGNVGSVHDRPIKSIGRKKNLSVRSHGMITRLSKATDFENENIVPKEMKAFWNLKEEIAKVIKAGRVLGLNFNGREKDMVEEIVRRIKAGTFGSDSLPCCCRAFTVTSLRRMAAARTARAWARSSLSSSEPKKKGLVGDWMLRDTMAILCLWLGLRTSSIFSDSLPLQEPNPVTNNISVTTKPTNPSRPSHHQIELHKPSLMLMEISGEIYGFQRLGLINDVSSSRFQRLGFWVPTISVFEENLVVSSLLYSTNKRTVLELIPPRWRTLWKEWDLRLAVLISLFFHIILSILGNRRKYSRKLWIRISVWSAYTAAESVTIFALGIISNNLSYKLEHRGNVGRLDTNIELATVWAQFLFLHLGGPDSITAYVLEDNELWLRQLLGLVSQTCGAIYVILLSWTDEGSRLQILSIMMFTVGFIKYGERTWVLRVASYQMHRKSVQLESLDHFNEGRYRRGGDDVNELMKPGYNINRLEGYIVKIDKCPRDDVPVSIDSSGFNNYSIFDEKTFVLVNRFLSVTKHVFVDAAISSSYKDTVQTFFRNISMEDAFQLNEIQIGMIYDLHYTKAPLLHSRKGLCLRVITFFLTCCSLVFFSANFLDHKAEYSKIDLCITFLLLVVAVLLEIYSALVLIFSDRFALWLIKHNKTSTFRTLNSFRLVKSPRWSNTMSQYTLIRGTRKTKPLLSCGQFLKIGTLKCHEWNAQVTKDLKEMIFRYFKEKSEELPTAGKIPFTALPTTTIVTNQEEEQAGTSIWEQYEYKIIIWSIATEILYYIDRKKITPCFLPKLKAINRISRYMLYLLVKNPSMISAEIGLMVVSFEDLTNETMGNHHYYYDTSKAQACKEFLERFLDIQAHDENQNRLLIHNAMKLVKELQESTARNQELRRGGEFITLVWLLMAYFGLTDHFQIPSLPRHPILNRLIAK
ncbi:hypothetical protein EZV62_003202 [Acer yangbiense]|uniref:DUF4220 domain-containing protein n=1 Tax=Acer yangbiense TaxID=1000413 RepID=A0A5C7IG26_9ROSI|nr:hypothetical protein EZV62_003202 [Acer yangbiense]